MAKQIFPMAQGWNSATQSVAKGGLELEAEAPKGSLELEALPEGSLELEAEALPEGSQSQKQKEDHR
jgi:hypothetical protein